MDDDGIVVAMLSIPTGRRGPSPSWESCGPGNSDLSRVVAQILQIVVLVFRSTRSDGTACRVEGNLIGFEILEHDAQRSATTSTPTWPFASGLRGADRRRLEYSRTVERGELGMRPTTARLIELVADQARQARSKRKAGK